ncbi:MAG: DUF4920 domain-containing protein [Elusimicrobia bacterium]|nr:DUF4920 domain-containing protein [Elusimicrobiota bacterium]
MIRSWSAAALVALSLPLSAGAAEKKSFGSAITLTQPVELADALTKPEKYHGKEILVEGHVRSVCQKKGCWMMIGDDKREARVTFKDYAFFVPKNSKGKRVRAQGIVFRDTVPVKDAKHYLKDAGAPKAEIEKVKEPVPTVTFTASGVAFLD